MIVVMTAQRDGSRQTAVCASIPFLKNQIEKCEKI